MTKDEALKMALDLAEEYVKEHGYGKVVVNAIKEALAQPEQEPAAWRYNGKLHEVDPIDWATGTVTPLYPSAQFSKPWVNPSIKEYEDIMLANLTPRTDDERDGIMGALNDMVGLLKEKNHD
jgi:hypothetical protein